MLLFKNKINEILFVVIKIPIFLQPILFNTKALLFYLMLPYYNKLKINK